MDREAGVGSLHADCTSTSQLASYSYATGLSTDSPRTFGIAVYIEAGQFLTVKACMYVTNYSYPITITLMLTS